MKAVILGFILHLIFLLSVFDIYFKSPIIENIAVQENSVVSPAKRIVLFVADGLRADSFYSLDKNNFESPSPYLRSVIENQGAWGVAHSRVPTESRPGHIAIIAGFYEDPSAVFTGWKDNLVEFDSLFNQSTVTYSWGSPDIVPMFQKGASKDKVKAFCYNEGDEDFSGKDSTQLNTWVFDRVDEFFKSAEHDQHLKNQLQAQGVVFFLHLLGPDVAGHSNKPHSRQYKENIRVVDEGVQRIEKLFSEFYNDNKTAFVYTSDHGMTDWGSHGDGSVSETEVPLVAWGAGIRGPRTLEAPDLNTPPHWDLSKLQRTDTAQADLCPLMAVLAGISIPVHSVGKLPIDYLSITDKDKMSALLLNAKQLRAQFTQKRAAVEAKLLPWLYRPYAMFVADEDVSMYQQVARIIHGERFDLDICLTLLNSLIKMTLKGLEYYHSYFEVLLMFCVSLSFLGWICWSLCYLLEQSNSSKVRRNSERNLFKLRDFSLWPDSVFTILISIAVLLIYVQSLPFQFYIYCCLPLVLWWSVLRHIKTEKNLLVKYNPLQIVGVSVILLFLLELLVMTFYERWLLSVVVAAVGVWPLTLRERRHLVPTKMKISWFSACLVLSVFPTLPVVGKQTHTDLVLLCGGLWLLFGLVSWYYLDLPKTGKTIFYQLVMISLTVAVIFLTARDFEDGKGLQSWNQAAAWLLLVCSLVSPLVTSVQMTTRLLSIGQALAVPFLLLCVGHEAFFLLSLFVTLCLWIYLEACLSKTKIAKLQFKEEIEANNTISMDDFRRSFFFLMFILLSFFGTGNIASVSSFDVSWVRCFLTVFAPFTMMTLILLKTVIPFLLVTCCFRAISIISKVKAETVCVTVLIYCDIMGLHFFHSVTNKGSWLQIGSSVSHFVIMEVTVLFLAVLYYIARLYTSTVIVKSTTLDTPIFPLWEPLDKKLKRR